MSYFSINCVSHSRSESICILFKSDKSSYSVMTASGPTEKVARPLLASWPAKTLYGPPERFCAKKEKNFINIKLTIKLNALYHYEVQKYGKIILHFQGRLSRKQSYYQYVSDCAIFPAQFKSDFEKWVSFPFSNLFSLKKYQKIIKNIDDYIKKASLDIFYTTVFILPGEILCERNFLS